MYITCPRICNSRFYLLNQLTLQPPALTTRHQFPKFFSNVQTVQMLLSVLKALAVFATAAQAMAIGSKTADLDTRAELVARTLYVGVSVN